MDSPRISGSIFGKKEIMSPDCCICSIFFATVCLVTPMSSAIFRIGRCPFSSRFRSIFFSRSLTINILLT